MFVDSHVGSPLFLIEPQTKHGNQANENTILSAHTVI